MFKKTHTAVSTAAKIVIPAKAGIHGDTGFRVKPGMTEYLRLLLPLTIWSCHAWVAPAFRLYHGLAAAVFAWKRILRSRTRVGMTERVETNSHVMLNPEGVMPNSKCAMPNAQSVMPNLFRHLSRAALFQHLICSFSAVSRRSINNPPAPRPLEPLNRSGFTVIELVVVIVIIGILAAIVLPNINFSTTSSTVSSWGAAYIIASDIRYTQECAMASMVPKGISFTNGSFTSGQIVYTFPATAPSTSSLDPTGRLPSAVTIGTPGGNPFTLTFNSLGEPEESTSNSITVTVGGITRTITVTQYTGMVSIS